MTREFTNLNACEQRVALYDKVDAIEKHLKEQNGKVNKNSRDLHTIKIIGAVLFVIFCVLTGLGIPHIPGL